MSFPSRAPVEIWYPAEGRNRGVRAALVPPALVLRRGERLERSGDPLPFRLSLIA